MQTIELTKVRKCYDQFVAVNDLSFGIQQGGVFGLLGPNGAGKTSTIRMMIGITAPDSGQINLFGKPFERKALHKVGYLPEERGLYKKMKISEQLVFLGELHGMTNSAAKQKAVEQQKIQFIAALIHDPDFVIMDEPFFGLDPVNAGLLKDVMLDLKKQGKTILFSTHRMDQVEKLCDSICLINRGTAVLQGDLKSIKARYGKNNVQIEYDGNGDFLDRNPLVSKFDNYGNYVEVRLAPGADAQKLLQMVSERSRINRFELMEPSLEEIFIDTVGKTDA